MTPCKDCISLPICRYQLDPDKRLSAFGQLSPLIFKCSLLYDFCIYGENLTWKVENMILAHRYFERL